MKAYIIVGFTEGEWHKRRMQNDLQLRGIVVTNDYRQADYIIAHSGGCYEIPPLSATQILMYINPTYWPNRTLRAME